MTLLSLYASQPAEVNADAERGAVMNEVIDQVNNEYPPARLANPSAAERSEIQERVTVLAANAFRRRNMRPGPQYETALGAEITRRLLGLGFLDLLLPPVRTDISEIAVYSSGLIQIMRKGAVRFDTVDLHPDSGEIWRVLDRILGRRIRRSMKPTRWCTPSCLPPSTTPAAGVSPPCTRQWRRLARTRRSTSACSSKSLFYPSG